MKSVLRREPATIVGVVLALYIIASPILFKVDLVQLDIKYLEFLKKDDLDNLLVGFVLILVGIAIDRAFEMRRGALALQKSQKRLEQAVLQFVETMAQALDARDKYTAGHSERVSENATTLAKAMGLTANEIDIIRIGGRMHDIGKIGVPDMVLQKPGKLTDEEYALIKLHPQIGKRILEEVEQFKDYLPIVELHHEDYDGRGYPYGLDGLSVPLGVRIVHVVDVYDAITSNRAYRKAMPTQKVLNIMAQGAGKQFDPDVLKVFLDALNEGRLVKAEVEG